MYFEFPQVAEEQKSDEEAVSPEKREANAVGYVLKPLKKEWKNRSRALVFCSRGTSYRDRHLMNDLKAMMPHAKGDSKFNKKQNISAIREICELKNCDKCVYFECRKKKDLYLWLASLPTGPSVKFLVHNVHTMLELKLSGNCLKGSRPLLSFDSSFDELPYLSLIKELLIQVFATPNHHPRSQPFVDHTFCFSFHDGVIWFRNYQIVNEDDCTLEEIGPRMVLEVIRIYSGCFGGPILYNNEEYQSPNLLRRLQKQANANKYVENVGRKVARELRVEEAPDSYPNDVRDEVFVTEPEEQLESVQSKQKLLSLKKRIEKFPRRKRVHKEKKK